MMKVSNKISLKIGESVCLKTKVIENDKSDGKHDLEKW
jgi:hypothetical protein